MNMLYDIYHDQIATDDVIVTFRESVDQIGHVADVPGHHEPETGELNYTKILVAINAVDYDGHVSMSSRQRRNWMLSSRLLCFRSTRTLPVQMLAQLLCAPRRYLLRVMPEEGYSVN